MAHTMRLVANSWEHFFGLLGTNSLHLSHEHKGILYSIEGRGSFKVFRETHSRSRTGDRPVVLVVGFRLKALRSSRILHWFFQRVCILTTPFWAGLKGFRVKLWMVDPTTKNYLGIYEWEGRQHAQNYVDALVRVLQPLSVSNSVWYQVPTEQFETFLENHKRGPHS